ncbi:MAG: hypothetical protein H6622_09995 [Halobacteriovoraceae bacterium]|nr:hypothetical protein [Halobacteriovoraceae bacterium]
MTKKKDLIVGQLDIIERVFTEAKSYESLDDLEKIVEKGMTFSNLPVQPLYMTIKSNTPEIVSKVLSKLSSDQRKVFLDLDLWKKDEVDVNSFQYWLQTYSLVDDEDVRSEFVKSEEFFLFLKSRFNIWTFDTEDPQYPDHDYYFLTDDTQLLFEYDEEFDFVDEVKMFLRQLYSDLGVENAYALIFKYVNEPYLSLQEEAYVHKKEFLRDYGLVDYFDSLEVEATYQNESLIKHFITKKENAKINLNRLSLGQSLPRSTIIPYQQELGSVRAELAKIQDENRLDYLHFNFIRLVNSTLSSNDALKDGAVAANRIGKITCSFLTLGLDYILSNHSDKDFLVFNKFDFTEVYKIGKSLIQLVLKDIKKELNKTKFETKFESFLGKNWCEYLDFSFDKPPKLSLGDESKEQTKAIDHLVIYHKWVSKKDTFCQMLPFIQKFFETYEELINSGRIQDEYYLNYNLQDIDFEALILSSFANYTLGTSVVNNEPKLAVTIEEFKKFASIFVDIEGRVKKNEVLLEKISSFVASYGLENISGIEKYIRMILIEHLEGYDFNNLSLEDYAHVGGPIILNTH